MSGINFKKQSNRTKITQYDNNPGLKTYQCYILDFSTISRDLFEQIDLSLTKETKALKPRQIPKEQDVEIRNLRLIRGICK
jgi:hypothetical protein